MTKVAINCNYGGFALSLDILARVHELSGIKVDDFERVNEYYMSDIQYRTNPALCQAILEARAKGTNGSLRVVEVPEGVQWVITEEDGYEMVEEVHRKFRDWATL